MLTISDNFFSKRIVFDNGSFIAKERCWLEQKLPSWLLSSFYRHENKETIKEFRQTFKAAVGHRRYKAICAEQGIHLKRMQKKGLPLSERQIARLMITSKIVSMKDIQRALNEIKSPNTKWTTRLTPEMKQELHSVESTMDLTDSQIDALYTLLSTPLNDTFEINSFEPANFCEKVAEKIIKMWNIIFHDSYKSRKKFVTEIEKNRNRFITDYYEELAFKAPMFEGVKVGTLYPAPNLNGDPEARRYYRLAAKLISANGQVSHFLMPTHKESGLDPLRIIRGTAFSFSGLDAINYFITDFETEIGRQGFESGVIFNDHIKRLGDNWTVIGYSAGGCMAQWIAADSLEHIKELFLLRSPGVPKRVVDQFNEKAQELGRRIVISVNDAKGDFVHHVGDHRLGYQAPDNVTVIYRESRQTGGAFPHVSPPLNRSRSGAIIGTPPEQVQERLSNQRYSRLETLRKIIGGKILTPLLKAIRYIFRGIFSGRVEGEKGLWIEKINAFRQYETKWIPVEKEEGVPHREHELLLS